MIRSANATWRGNLMQGAGSFGVGSGAFTGQKYSFGTRFKDEPGTNPEELIAAAHASCFSMALSAQLSEKGITAEVVETECKITFENLALTKSSLKTTVRAPGADKVLVEQCAEGAKIGCPISKVLKLEVTLDLTVIV